MLSKVCLIFLCLCMLAFSLICGIRQDGAGMAVYLFIGLVSAMELQKEMLNGAS